MFIPTHCPFNTKALVKPLNRGAYTVKKGSRVFPSPAGMSLTKLPLGRNNSVMTSLFSPRESLVVTSRLGTGTSRSFFYGVFQHFWIPKYSSWTLCMSWINYEALTIYWNKYHKKDLKRMINKSVCLFVHPECCGSFLQVFSTVKHKLRYNLL